MRLRLHAYADMLDRAGDGRVGDSGEGAGEIILRVGEVGLEGIGGGVGGFEAAAGPVEGAELDGDLVW